MTIIINYPDGTEIEILDDMLSPFSAKLIWNAAIHAVALTDNVGDMDGASSIVISLVKPKDSEM